MVVDDEFREGNAFPTRIFVGCEKATDLLAALVLREPHSDVAMVDVRSVLSGGGART